MNKDQAKKDLENVLDVIQKFSYDKAYSKLLSDFMKKKNVSVDVDSYVLSLSDTLLEFSRKDKSRRALFLNGHRLMRRLAHQIYREYNDGRVNEGFLSLVR